MRKVKKNKTKKKLNINIKDKLSFINNIKFKKKEKIIKGNKNNNKANIDKKVDNNKIKDKSKNSFIKDKNNSLKKSTTKNKKVDTRKKRNSNKVKNKRSLWKRILTVFLILCIIGVLAITAFFGYVVITSPKFDEEAFNVQDQSVVYDINGEIIAKLGVEKRESIEYDQLPQVLIDAIIATEDSRFFQHNGVDLPRFIKATILQLMGRDEGGASTLTMQTVKNNLTKKDTEEKSKIQKIIRKFQDVYLSVFKVEKEFTKEDILMLYVNNYNLGYGVWGVEEASKYYFGKSASQLSLPEASLIAGLFQAPVRHDPYRNIDSATKRRSTVLKLMVNHGYITQEEADMANSVSIDSLLVGIKDNTEYRGFIDTVIDEVIELTGDNPEVVSMKIYTTMERGIQDGINKVLSNNAWYWTKAETQAGIAVVNVDTGAISAVGAGRNRTGKRTFNRATGAYRQPGSTAKPIFAYGPGMEYNNFSPYTLFVDEPWSYTNGPSINNWDGQFQGLITSRQALQVSRNIPALKAIQIVGMKNSQKFAYSLGLDVSLNTNSENYRILKDGVQDNTINEAYAIGGVAEGFTPLEMAAAYSGFASGGYFTKPYSVLKIEYRESGEEIEYKHTKERVMSDSTAYMINNILESAVNYGFSGGAKVNGSHVAAKTGTSNFPDSVMKKYNLPGNAVNDLWTVAYTSKYSVAVWYGYDDVTQGYNTSGGGQKEQLTADIWQYIPKDTVGWKQPSSVVSSPVELESWPAKLPSEYTPKELIGNEIFKRGTQPTEVSDRFRKLNDINNVNQKIVGNTATITWEYVTPTSLSETYLNKYFSNSVFGNSKNKLKQERIEYNNKILGKVLFVLYEEDEDGKLTKIGSTEKTTYTYVSTKPTTLIIKAEHSQYKNNASDGIKVLLNFATEPIQTLDAQLTANTTFKVGEFTDIGIKKVIYGKIDVTKNSTIKYNLYKSNDDILVVNSQSELEQEINTLPSGTYKINYIISYKDNEIVKSKNIILN